MPMELLGGSMPAGQPVCVSTGRRSHVFAIAAGGVMNHWLSTDGGPWSGPTPLPGGNLAASVPCAIALPDGSVHVFAIMNGGMLSRWYSVDGSNWIWLHDPRAPIPGGWNGLAAASPGGTRVEVFATTAGGIIQYSFVGTQALPQLPPLPGSGGLPTRLLAATSSGPGRIDVFAVDPAMRMPLHWHFNGGWSRNVAGIPGLHVNSGIAVVTTAPGNVELFAVTGSGTIASCTVNGTSYLPRFLPAAPAPVLEGVPAAVAGNGTVDVFAIAQGGALLHWRFGRATWRTPIAHDARLAPGGMSAVRGAGGLEAFGIQSGQNNSLLHWPAGIAAADTTPWRNWANNRTSAPEGHCYPATLDELVSIVKAATRQSKRARAVGSSWSFSDIAVTPGYIIETNKMTAVLDTVLPVAKLDSPSSVVTGSDALARYVHVEAGIQLENLMTYLDQEELAPATMGGAAGQTLGGVISTAVHGSHFRLPPFPDWVRAVHLVGPDGTQYWIEPVDKPITKDVELAQALGPDVIIKRDNDWFDTALVTVGSLGIVYSVILEVRAAYKLVETRTALPWASLRPRLADSTVFTDNVPDAVQVAIDPGSFGKVDPDCFLTIRDAVGMSFASTPADTSFDPQAAFCEGDSLEALYRVASPAVFGTILGVLSLIPGVAPLLAATLPILAPVIATDAAVPILYNLLKAGGPGAVGDLLGMVLDQHPAETAALISEITKSAQRPGTGIDLAHQVMARRNRGECIARGLALELALDATSGSHLRYVDDAIALLKDEAAMGRFLGGWFSLRFVGRSRAVLAPQQSELTCMVEFVGLRTLSSTRPLLSALESLGRTHGAVQHWGMFEDLTAADVSSGYPRLNTWRRVRWELANQGTVHTFDNEFTDRCGLSAPPSRRAPSWQPLGGEFNSGPGAASWGRNRLDVFGRGMDNALWANAWDGSSWAGWQQLSPDPIDSDPDAVSWGPDRIDVFARGTDRQMYTMSWDGTGWSGWSLLEGGEFASGPAVASWAAGRLDVLARGLDNALWANAWDGSSWSGWQQVAADPIDSDPAAVSSESDRIDVFALGSDRQMYTLSWEGGAWSGWRPLGGEFSSGPTTVSSGRDRLDVLARGMDHALWTNTREGGSWSGWRQVAAEPLGSDPAAVSSRGRIDVFVRGTDGQMWWRVLDGKW